MQELVDNDVYLLHIYTLKVQLFTNGFVLNAVMSYTGLCLEKHVTNIYLYTKRTEGRSCHMHISIIQHVG